MFALISIIRMRQDKQTVRIVLEGTPTLEGLLMVMLIALMALLRLQELTLSKGRTGFRHVRREGTLRVERQCAQYALPER